MVEFELIKLAGKAVENLKQNNKTLALAESCTGGWVSKLITDISGASAVYQGGVCSYSNEVKMKVLGVKKETLAAFGAVSQQVAVQMAEGVRIAGPLSDNTAKPVGLIYVAIADGNKTTCTELKNNFTENIRLQNRFSAAKTALSLLGDI